MRFGSALALLVLVLAGCAGPAQSPTTAAAPVDATAPVCIDRVCLRADGPLQEPWPGAADGAQVVLESQRPIYAVVASSSVLAFAAYDNASDGTAVFALHRATGRLHQLAAAHPDAWSDNPRLNGADEADARVLYVHGSDHGESALRRWDPATNRTTQLTRGYLPFWYLHEWNGDWAVGDWARQGRIVAFNLATRDGFEVDLPILTNGTISVGTNGYHLVPGGRLLAAVSEVDGSSTLREVDLATGTNRTLRRFSEVVIDFLRHPDGSMLLVIERSRDESWVNRWESAAGDVTWLDREGRSMDNIDLRGDWLAFKEHPAEGLGDTWDLVLYHVPSRDYVTLLQHPTIRALDHSETHEEVFAAVEADVPGSDAPFAVVRFAYPDAARLRS